MESTRTDCYGFFIEAPVSLSTSIEYTEDLEENKHNLSIIVHHFLLFYKINTRLID